MRIGAFMRIQLSDHFGYGRLLKFVFPSIAMMIFTSIYGVVDGLFVSNFVGKEPFAAINIIMPLFMILAAIGFMMGAGGTAIVASVLGQGKSDKAKEYFSMLVYITAAFGVLAVIFGQIFLPSVSRLLGADNDTIDYCVRYGRIVIVAMPFYMLQNLFQSFFITAEKPKLGLYVIVLAGVTNMVLDALFVAVFPFGLEGAAVATAISQAVGAIIPVVYFLRPNDSLLKLGKARFHGKVLLKTCTNGSSELMSNVSASIVTILFNRQLMRFGGNDAVAAYGVVMYVSFIIAAVFIGYSMGSAPIISYNYGADNKIEMTGVFKKSTVMIALSSVFFTVVLFLLSRPFSSIFVGYDKALLDMTVNGLKIFSISFLFCGYNIFGSAFFTALNNGVISAVISFLRTCVFQVLGVLILPEIFSDGLNGVWVSIIVAESLSLVVTLIMIFVNRKKYGYMTKTAQS